MLPTRTSFTLLLLATIAAAHSLAFCIPPSNDPNEVTANGAESKDPSITQREILPDLSRPAKNSQTTLTITRREPKGFKFGGKKGGKKGKGGGGHSNGATGTGKLETRHVLPYLCMMILTALFAVVAL